MNVSKYKRAAVIATCGLALGIGGVFALRARHTRVMEPIDAAPRDAFLVATIDLDALRNSPISKALLGGDDQSPSKTSNTAKALGLGPLEAACGFDPLSRIDRLAIAAPEHGARGEFGIAAKVRVSRQELELCTGALGGGQTKAATRNVGSFVVVDDAEHRSIGYAPEGLLVIGKGNFFGSMLAAADKKEPNLEASAEHAALRKAITGEGGWQAPTVLVSALLPRPLREHLKSELADEVRAGDASATIMNGVLGVSGVAFALRAGEVGKNVDARLELACDTPEACGAVQKLIEKKRLDASKELGLRMLGFGPLFDSLKVTQDGAHVHASVSMGAVELATSLDRAMKLRGFRKARAAEHAAQREASASSPDAGGHVTGPDAGGASTAPAIPRTTARPARAHDPAAAP